MLGDHAARVGLRHRVAGAVVQLAHVLDEAEHLLHGALDGAEAVLALGVATVAQEQLDLNIAIINNGYLGMVRQWQEFFYDKRYAATPLLNPNFAKLADAFGIAATRVTKRSEVAEAVAAARRIKRAAVIDFQVEQEDTVYPMVPAGADLHKMIRRPSPIVETAAD